MRCWCKIAGEFCGKRRELVVVVGRRYLVDPLDPRQKKNRGRPVVVLGLRSADPGTDENGNNDGFAEVALVEFLDDRTVGKVGVEHLAETTEGLERQYGGYPDGVASALSLLGMLRPLGASRAAASQES